MNMYYNIYIHKLGSQTGSLPFATFEIFETRLFRTTRPFVVLSRSLLERVLLLLEKSRGRHPDSTKRRFAGPIQELLELFMHQYTRRIMRYHEEY